MVPDHPPFSGQYQTVEVLSRDELAAKLREARLTARITEPEMGRLMGLSPRMIRYIERGKRGARPHVHRWAQVTGAPEEWFFDAD